MGHIYSRINGHIRLGLASDVHVPSVELVTGGEEASNSRCQCFWLKECPQWAGGVQKRFPPEVLGTRPFISKTTHNEVRSPYPVGCEPSAKLYRNCFPLHDRHCWRTNGKKSRSTNVSATETESRHFEGLRSQKRDGDHEGVGKWENLTRRQETLVLVERRLETQVAVIRKGVPRNMANELQRSPWNRTSTHQPSVSTTIGPEDSTNIES